MSTTRTKAFLDLIMSREGDLSVQDLQAIEKSLKGIKSAGGSRGLRSAKTSAEAEARQAEANRRRQERAADQLAAQRFQTVYGQQKSAQDKLAAQKFSQIQKNKAAEIKAQNELMAWDQRIRNQKIRNERNYQNVLKAGGEVERGIHKSRMNMIAAEERARAAASRRRAKDLYSLRATALDMSYLFGNLARQSGFALAGAGALGAGAVSGIVGGYSHYQESLVTLTNILKSKEKAESSFASLRQYALTSPSDLRQTVDAFKLLVNYGFQFSELLGNAEDKMDLLTKHAFVFQKPIEQVAAELVRLREGAFRVRESAAAGFGKSFFEEAGIPWDSKKNRPAVMGDQLIEMMFEHMKTRYKGVRFNDIFSVVLSNIRDAAYNFEIEVGKALGPTFQAIATRIMEGLQRISKAVGTPAFQRSFAKIVKDIADAADGMLAKVEAIIDRISQDPDLVVRWFERIAAAVKMLAAVFVAASIASFIASIIQGVATLALAFTGGTGTTIGMLAILGSFVVSLIAARKQMEALLPSLLTGSKTVVQYQQDVAKASKAVQEAQKKLDELKTTTDESAESQEALNEAQANYTTAAEAYLQALDAETKAKQDLLTIEGQLAILRAEEDQRRAQRQSGVETAGQLAEKEKTKRAEDLGRELMKKKISEGKTVDQAWQELAAEYGLDGFANGRTPFTYDPMTGGLYGTTAEGRANLAQLGFAQQVRAQRQYGPSVTNSARRNKAAQDFYNQYGRIPTEGEIDAYLNFQGPQVPMGFTPTGATGFEDTIDEDALKAAEEAAKAKREFVLEVMSGGLSGATQAAVSRGVENLCVTAWADRMRAFGFDVPQGTTHTSQALAWLQSNPDWQKVTDITQMRPGDSIFGQDWNGNGSPDHGAIFKSYNPDTKQITILDQFGESYRGLNWFKEGYSLSDSSLDTMLPGYRPRTGMPDTYEGAKTLFGGIRDRARQLLKDIHDDRIEQLEGEQDILQKVADAADESQQKLKDLVDRLKDIKNNIVDVRDNLAVAWQNALGFDRGADLERAKQARRKLREAFEEEQRLIADGASPEEIAMARVRRGEAGVEALNLAASLKGNEDAQDIYSALMGDIGPFMEGLDEDLKSSQEIISQMQMSAAERLTGAAAQHEVAARMLQAVARALAIANGNLAAVQAVEASTAGYAAGGSIIGTGRMLAARARPFNGMTLDRAAYDEFIAGGMDPERARINALTASPGGEDCDPITGI